MWLSKVNLEGENEMAIFRDGQKPKGIKSEGEMNMFLKKNVTMRN